MSTGNNYFFKIIMLGSSGAGKTCIVQRYINDIFEGPDHKATTGFDFLTKKIEHGGKQVDLQVWDTAGQEKYKAITKMYYKEVHGAILVYDTTDKSSFDKVKSWMEDLDMNGNKLEVRSLVGSKMDLYSNRQVTLYEAKKYSRERNLQWSECSALSGEGVKELFDSMIDNLIKKYDNDDEFKKIIGKSTRVDIGPAINEADAALREKGYKLHKEKAIKKSGKKCC